MIQWIEGQMDQCKRKEEKRIAESKLEHNKLSRKIDNVKTTIYKSQEEVRFIGLWE